ncbi:MAG: hypothetical protein KBG84_12665, partial [Planctomycetes bacterium]|nr:hypothetical protein [Planctomycetota bacterium]
VDGGPAHKVTSFHALEGFSLQVTPEILEGGLRLSVEAVSSRLMGSPNATSRSRTVRHGDDIIEMTDGLQLLRRAQASFEITDGESLLVGPFDLLGKGRVVYLLTPRISE